MIKQFKFYFAIHRQSLLALLLVAFATSVVHAVNYRVERIASDLAQPTFVSQAPGDPSNIIYYSTRITAADGTGGGFSPRRFIATLTPYYSLQIVRIPSQSR
jgi:hypothetical protein